MAVLLKNGELITHEGIQKQDLLLEGEKIKAFWERDLPLPEGDLKVIDLSGKMIMPGIIDAHTHYQLRSRTTITADDFQSGSLSAAAGGVTTFIDYIDDNPHQSLPLGVEGRIEEALGSSCIDFSFHQSLYRIHQKTQEELKAIKGLGINSIKIFTTYRQEGYMFPLHALPHLCNLLKEEKLLLTVHAEDDEIIMAKEGEYKDKILTVAMHGDLRPVESEAIAIKGLALEAQRCDIPLYIAHLSSKAGYDELLLAKGQGVKIYGETTPHYLILDRGFLRGPDPQLYLMTPPLREKKDQEALWQALREGSLQVVATDHCAFHRDEKLQSTSPLHILPGIPGSETLLPLVHHFGVRTGRLSYPQLVQVLSTAPAKIFGLYPKKGSLVPGTDADLVVFDQGEEMELSYKNLHSNAAYSPYEHVQVKGYPIMTFLRGRIISLRGIPQGIGGRFIPAQTSSLYDAP